jgi:hypothetical protein
MIKYLSTLKVTYKFTVFKPGKFCFVMDFDNVQSLTWLRHFQRYLNLNFRIRTLKMFNSDGIGSYHILNLRLD